MTKNRKHEIQSHPVRYWTGKRASGDMVLIGPMLPNIVIYEFDSSGDLLRREIVPLTKPLTWDGSRYIPRPGFVEALQSEVNTVLNRLQAHESTIAILPFFDQEQSIGVLDLPSDYNAFLQDPSYADNEDEAADFRESIEEWKRTGKFVLVWGSELWLNSRGELIAS